MTLLISWIAFPALLAAACLGCGLLVERLAGRLPGVLLLPLGLAVIVGVTQVTTYWDATAELSTPVVVVVALLGIALGWARIGARRLDRPAALAAVGVFVLFGAPVFLSGQATFAGYTVLGDTSIHFIIADHVLQHGRDVTGLAPSSYEFSLAAYLGTAYPLGSQLVVGTLAPLTGQDVAWVYQPYLSFLAAMTALSLYSLLTPMVASRWARGAVAFVAAQPALFVGYALQGSVKEVATVWAITLLLALVPVSLRRANSARDAIPLAVASAAALGVINLSVAPWLAPTLLAVLAALIWSRSIAQWRMFAAQAGAFAVVVGILAFPSFVAANTFVTATTAVVTAQAELGNLLGPLDPWQMFGIWLTGDYRQPVMDNLTITRILIGTAAFSAVLGTVWMLRRRAGGALLFLVVSLLGWWYVTRRGSPWADGKALMIVSPAIVFTSMLGAVALADWGRRRWGVLLGAIIAGGVLWSNALAYHDVSLAPRDRLSELEAVGKSIDGQGPTLYTEFEEFAKHFLRQGDPEGAGEGWQRRLRPLRNGQFPHMGFSHDIDEFELDYVQGYRTIVLRRSPVGSRPPSNYRLTHRGQHYEVWQRRRGSAQEVSEHLSLGDRFTASATPSCRDVMAIGSRARKTADRIAYVERPRPAVVQPTAAQHRASWFVDPTDGSVLRPVGPGKVKDSFTVRQGGEHEVWVQGSFGRGYEVSVDNRPVGELRNHLSGRNQYALSGRIRLATGAHAITLERGGGNFRPGNGGLRMLGPIAIVPRRDDRSVRTVDAREARSLCGRSLDWIEIVRR